MNRKDKFIIVGLILVLVFIAINIVSTINTMSDYEARKQSRNDRWKQVEERIIDKENKVNILEREIEQWKK